MADAQTFTKPAEIAGIQEANTAVLPSGMPLNELLLRSSQIKWAHDEAAKQREEKQMADNMAMFDFNTVGVWDKDLAAINKLKDDGIKKFGDVNFLKRYNAGDLNALSEYQQWKTGLQSSIDLSKRRMVYDGANRELMNKDKKYQNETNIQNAKKFGDTPLSGDFYSMGVTPSANPYDVVAYSTKLAPDITETKEVKNGDGTTTKQTVSSVPLTGNKSLESAAQDILKDTEQIQNINQLLIDAKTTHDPNDDYITYDFTQVDKNGNPIPIHKKVADLTQQDIVNGLLVEERYRPQTDQTLEGSVYHPPQGDGATKTKYPYYSSGAVTTKIPSKDGQVEMVDSKTEYEKYTKDQKGLDGKDYKAGDIVRDKNGVSVHKKVEKEVPSKVGMYNGNLYSSPNEQPKNVPIDPPSQVYDIASEKWLDKNTIGTGVWTVSLVKDGTIYRKQNSTGGYNWLGYDPNNPNPDTKGYTPMDMVQVTKEDGKTYLIPKNGDIAEYISKLKREEGGGSTTTTAPTNTETKGGGTPQQNQTGGTDLTKSYINVLDSQYKSMGQSKPDAYKNSWQYRPQEIDKNYDEFAKSDSKREKGNLLTNAGYKAIEKFEFTKGTPEGKSMEGLTDQKGKVITNGYSKTQEAEIKKYVEENIGMDVWNKLPPKLQTQVYSLAFNSVKDDRIIKGLAQALAPDKIKTDADRQKLTGDEAKTIIKDYFSGTSQQTNTGTKPKEDLRKKYNY